jgi:hemerythrin superfamily protein
VFDHEYKSTEVTAVLRADHRRAEQLLRAAGAGGLDGAARRNLTDELIIELIQHSSAEELFVFPAVREYVPGGAELADHELENHAEAERVMKILDALEPDDRSFAPQLTLLTSLVDAHIAHEEGILLPALTRATAPHFRDRLGEQVQVSKAWVPTRPHPNAPDTPPGNTLLAPGTGLVDRVRDALMHRGLEDE